MPARDTDDFSAFAGQEHMFFRLKDPFGMIREEVESVLRAQVPDTEVVSVATFEQPKFLTLGRKDGDGSLAVVTHFGFCVRAKLSVLFDQQRKGEVIDSAITFRARYQRHEDLLALTDLLVLDSTNPRALAGVLRRLRTELRKLPGEASEPLLGMLPTQAALQGNSGLAFDAASPAKYEAR